ncbi:MAG TPA: pyruvate kinase [Methylocella sp.]|nr:pyruvate kinase [Methylocella sp.]
MRRLRRCKIIATLGPASATPAMVAALFHAGADLFRINMSHASHEELRAQAAMIHSLREQSGRPVGILIDLQGPKLRIGTFRERAVTLVKGEKFVLDSDPAPGTKKRVWLPHPEVLRSLKPGHTVLIDDGKVKLHVTEAGAERAIAVIDVGGEISDRKGVCLPDTEIPVSSITGKDRADIEAGLDAGIDWVAISFVQRPEDVAEVKKLAAGRALVMSKIEKPLAISRLEEIVEISDALMVARGDLGVEMPLEKVPGLQKRINRTARRLGKPVVVATQMLESMVAAPVPTRAEVSDVATAVFEGADAVMLSAESAAGAYPREAVAMMDKIAIEVERDVHYRNIINAQRAAPEATNADAIAIAVAARYFAETLDLKAIVAWTSSGATAFRIARERPQAPILALTPSRETANRLTLVWGVHAVVTKDAYDIDDMTMRACKFAKREGFAEKGERIIIVAGMPFGTPGATNMVRIAVIEGEPSLTPALPLDS